MIGLIRFLEAFELDDVDHGDGRVEYLDEIEASGVREADQWTRVGDDQVDWRHAAFSLACPPMRPATTCAMACSSVVS